jgi:predicted nucleic acid-binding protein
VGDVAAYIDSSVILAALLGQPEASTAAAWWDAHPRRVSSVLLEAECRTVLRRAARSGARLPRGWLARQEATLAEWLDAVTLRIVDRSVIERLAIESALCGCRTLDALHLATALELRDHVGPELVLCTLDAEQAALAATLGLRVEAQLGGESV